MAFDKYVKLPGSERKPMPGAAKSGVLDPNEPMHVTVVLRERPASWGSGRHWLSWWQVVGASPAKNTRPSMAPTPRT